MISRDMIGIEEEAHDDFYRVRAHLAFSLNADLPPNANAEQIGAAAEVAKDHLLAELKIELCAGECGGEVAKLRERARQDAYMLRLLGQRIDELMQNLEEVE